MMRSHVQDHRLIYQVPAHPATVKGHSGLATERARGGRQLPTYTAHRSGFRTSSQALLGLDSLHFNSFPSPTVLVA